MRSNGETSFCSWGIDLTASKNRGEKVERVTSVLSQNIGWPYSNIIQTMNTADRSVGHIDYAIRRRFAFVDMIPKDLTEELGDGFHKVLFDKVAALFITNLSPQFERKMYN